MNKILIAYTTNSGSTEEVAKAIGEEIGKNGIPVDILRLEEVTSIESYQAVVVGAPMILGWHRAATKFIKQHQQELARKKVAYFCMAMSLTQTNENQIDAILVDVDPELPKSPKNSNRLSFRERYATLGNYLRPVLKAAPLVKPVSIGMFGGKLELFRLKILQLLFVMLIVRAQPGDLRNWPYIQRWAGQLRSVFLEV